MGGVGPLHLGPDAFHFGDALREALEQFATARCMRHFRVELHAIELAHLVGDRGVRRVLADGDDLEALGQCGDTVTVAHPDIVLRALGPDAVEERRGLGDLDDPNLMIEGELGHRRRGRAVNRQSVVGDVELAGGAILRRFFLQFHAAAFFREVEIVAARSGITAGFGVAAGAHGGDAEREEGVAEGGGFAGTEDDAGVWEADAEGADELDESAVIEPVLGFEAAGGWAEAREGALVREPEKTVEATPPLSP